MRVNFSQLLIRDYCEAMKRKEIIINRAYQRSAKVWPPQARSFLIETIILDFPIPKLSLYQVTDTKSKKAYKEIVDGQQRSQTIYDFYNNDLRISTSNDNQDISGKIFKELEDDVQRQFLEYALPVDIFVNTTPDEIREVFRRINSYTVPLNAEECRHALFQGAFKWFIYDLSKQYSQLLLDLGIFGENQLTRMADTKLFAEVCHAFLFGISTTNKAKLDNLYKANDDTFPDKSGIQMRIKKALGFILDLVELHKGPIMKPHNIYSLVLAVSHILKESGELNRDYAVRETYRFDRDIVITNLSRLAESLENQEEDGKYREFVKANISKTNVAEHRRIRFQWFCNALEPRLI
jgi:hypothetical protein